MCNIDDNIDIHLELALPFDTYIFGFMSVDKYSLVSQISFISTPVGVCVCVLCLCSVCSISLRLHDHHDKSNTVNLNAPCRPCKYYFVKYFNLFVYGDNNCFL